MAMRSLTERTSDSSSSSGGDAPTDMWINITKQILTRNNHNIISRALKYIALFEQRTEGEVNLEDCYMILSDLTNGHSSKHLNQESAAFFYSCLAKLAKSTKEGNTEQEEIYLNRLESNKLTATKTYGSKIDKNPLISDVNLNPFKVPANLLSNNGNS